MSCPLFSKAHQTTRLPSGGVIEMIPGFHACIFLLTRSLTMTLSPSYSPQADRPTSSGRTLVCPLSFTRDPLIRPIKSRPRRQILVLKMMVCVVSWHTSQDHVEVSTACMSARVGLHRPPSSQSSYVSSGCLGVRAQPLLLSNLPNETDGHETAAASALTSTGLC